MKGMVSGPILTTVHDMLVQLGSMTKLPSRKKDGVIGRDNVQALATYLDNVRGAMGKPGQKELPSPSALLDTLGHDVAEISRTYFLSVPQVDDALWRRERPSQLAGMHCALVSGSWLHMCSYC